MLRQIIRFAALLPLILTAMPAEAADPTGTWLRPSTGTHIQIFSCGGSLCGRIAAVKEATRQATVGRIVISGAQRVSDNNWEGDLFNTDDGATYSGHFSLTGSGTLRLQGCALALCKVETWTRVK